MSEKSSPAPTAKSTKDFSDIPKTFRTSPKISSTNNIVLDVLVFCPKITFGQVRKYTKAKLTLLMTFGKSKNQFGQVRKYTEPLFPSQSFSESPKITFGHIRKFPEAKIWFCVFLESPKMSFGKLRKNPEHTKLRRNTFLKKILSTLITPRKSMHHPS
jgi:hypothetical protein